MKKVDKPWGWEKWIVGDRIVMKELFIKEGNRFSKQYHVEKEEILHIVYGTGFFDLGDERIEYDEGMAFHVRPGTHHRLSAMTNTLVIEASTTELDDVVRLDDDYNRH